MKTKTVQQNSPLKKRLMIGIFLLFGLMLSSYRSKACTASFTYVAGVNGHYSFTSTSVGVTPQTMYTWNAGDGSGWHYSRLTFTHIYIANGTYTARLAIMDSNSCRDTASVIITVSNIVTPCTLSARFSYSVGAHGVVTFTSTSLGTNAYTQYYWSPGDSNQRVRGTNTFTHTYLYQGMYGVWLTIMDTGLSYCIDSIYEYINVPTADSSHCHLHANFSYVAGPNGEITFTNTSTGTIPSDRYYWSMNNSQINYGPGPFSHIFALDGTYYVHLDVVADSNGCSDTITIAVVVSNACNLQSNFTWAYDSSGQVKFTSTSIGTNAGTVYRWTFGDGSPTATGNDTITHRYPFIGNYSVTLWDSNAGGCISSVTKVMYIYNVDSLQACYTYYSDSLHAGKYDFSAACSKGTYPYTYYKWTPGDGDPSDSGLGMTTYTHTYLHNGPYSATLTEWYTILPHKPVLRSNPEYDLSSYTHLITVTTVTGIASLSDSKTYTIYPNPNNGSFTIAVNGMAGEKNAEIRISNMMGQVVYQANASINGNTLAGINMPAAANGIYLLQIITAGNTYTSRIAIQR